MMTLMAQGTVEAFFGMRLPQLVGEDNSIADWAKELNKTIQQALAAVFHQYIVAGNTLRYMLPSQD